MSEKASLRKDQIEDLAIHMKLKKSVNQNDPGAGKTGTVMVNQWYRWSEKGLRTIFIMPKGIIKKNVDEYLKFTNFELSDIAFFTGTEAQIRKEAAKDWKVALMGPDRWLRMLKKKEFDGQRWACDVDEFHKCFGGPRSQRTEAWLNWMNWNVDEFVGMTGTIIDGRLDTSFAVIYAIEPNYYPLGYDSFLHQHAYIDDYGRPYAWNNHDKLRNILAKHGVRRTFESIFGKQEVVHQTEWVDMPDPVQELYDELREQAVAELEQFFIDGENPGVNMMRARQIMEHFNDFPDLRKAGDRIDLFPKLRPPKLELLEEHIAHHLDYGTPVVIFSAMQPSQEAILTMAEKMGMKVGELFSRTPDNRRAKLDEAFRKGEIQGIVASSEIASIGYNWQDWKDQELNHVIFSCLSYKDSDYVQGYRRAVRRARKKPLRVTTQAYRNSLDQHIMRILERKSLEANKVDPTREVLKFMK